MESPELTTEINPQTMISTSDDTFFSENENYLMTSVPNSLYDFSYSTNWNIKFFKDNFFDHDIYKADNSYSFKNVSDFQNYLAYFFILRLAPRDSKILVIGDNYEKLFNRLTVLIHCSCWILENPDELEKDFITVSLKIRKYNSAGEYLEKQLDYFDIIISNSGADIRTTYTDEEAKRNVIFNLNRLLKYGGYINFNFAIRKKKGIIKFNELLYSFYKNHYQNLIPVFPYLHPEKAYEDKDLFIFREAENFNSDDNVKTGIDFFSYNVLLKKEFPQIDSKALLTSGDYLKVRPAYFFHHLIKCGGSSLGVALQKWFNFETDLYDKVEGIDEKLRYDYNCDVNVFKKYKFNIENLSSDYCIRGHFQHEGIFIHQRYPEIFKRPEEFKVFTFIREPLQVLISLYYFSKKRGYDYENISLEKCLMNTKNFLSFLLQCNEDNYKEVLDRYFFIGIVERMQESFDKFADILGKKRITVPRFNTTDKDSQVINLKPEFIEMIKKQNALDYKIYNYCKERFDKL